MQCAVLTKYWSPGYSASVIMVWSMTVYTTLEAYQICLLCEHYDTEVQ